MAVLSSALATRAPGLRAGGGSQNPGNAAPERPIDETPNESIRIEQVPGAPFLSRSRTSALLTWKVEIMASPSSPAAPTQDLDRPKLEAPAPLRAVHTTNFPTLLRRLGASLLVSTYQAGKLVLVRDEGDHLNTHFRAFQAPMGMALAGDRLALGTK